MNFVDFLAFHAWSPASQKCMCGEDVVWGDHPRHLADMVRVGDWEDHLDGLEQEYPITATDAEFQGQQ